MNYEILKVLNVKMIELEDLRNGSYDLHYMNETFLALLSNCDGWT